MAEPYYFKIIDPYEFLRYYLNIYQGDYNKRRARKVISLFPELKDKKLLDLGCGGGFYSLAAYRKGCKDITMVDLSFVCVKAAKVNLSENSHSNSEGIVADAASLPLRNECVDFALCIDLIEHVQEDRKLLLEIRRVLKKGGYTLIATQNSNSINYIIEAFIQRRVLRNHSWMGWDPTHLRFYNPKYLLNLLRNQGFTPIKIAGTYFVPYLLTNWIPRINRNFQKLLYYILMFINDKLESKAYGITGLFGWGIIVLAQKKPDLDGI